MLKLANWDFLRRLAGNAVCNRIVDSLIERVAECYVLGFPL
jgi:hypothetical protein